jgi:hypothetical protein
MTFGVTDLDSTLVFTWPEAPKLQEVERFPSGRVVRMHEEAWIGLKELGDAERLLVATSRTVSQFRHVALPPLPYVLAANGLDLIDHGHVMPEWREEQCHLLSLGAEPWHRLEAHCEEMFTACDLRLSVREPWLAVCIGDREAVATCCLRLGPAVSDWGWKVRAVGRKLYVFPEDMDKRETVRRALSRIGQGRYVAAGDSAMDLELLKAAERAIVPRGSELASADVSGISVTRAVGPDAGLEVVDWFRAALSEHEGEPGPAVRVAPRPSS